MRILFLFLFCLVPFNTHASFLMQYGLNYSSQKDDSEDGDFTESRIFHKAFLGATANQRKTLFLGWNINSWTSENDKSDEKDTYSMLEMGPRVQWFVNDNYNLYFSAEWNPYARGERKKSSTNRDIQGTSYGVGIGYRFRLSRLLGFGASLHYHTLSINEEKIDSNEDDISDKMTNIMPMLEFTILTR